MREETTLRPGYDFAPVIKGGWQLAGDHGPVDRDRAIADMEQFFDAGIYVGVEEMIGEFIAGMRRNRGSEVAGQIKMHTKLVPDFDRLEVMTAADIESIIDRSLRRLQVDQLPLVQFYWWDLSRGRPHEVLSCLKRIQEKGKIRLLGTTNWDAEAMAPFIDAGFDLVSTQVQYSPFGTRPAGAFTQWCAGHDMTMLCYGTLAGGFLTERWLDVDDSGHVFENRSLVKYRLIID